MEAAESLAVGKHDGPLHVYLSTVSQKNMSFYRRQCGYRELSVQECPGLPRGVIASVSTASTPEGPTNEGGAGNTEPQIAWFYKNVS